MYLGGGSSVSIYDDVTINLIQVGGNNSDLIGASVTLRNKFGAVLLSTTWDGTPIKTNLVGGTVYTLETSNVTGYYKKSQDIEYTAVLGDSTNIFALYFVPGVYIEDIEGNLYTRSGWNNSKTANSIVISSTSYAFRFAMNFEMGWPWTYGNISKQTSSVAAAQADFDWRTNWAQIGGYSYVDNYLFPDNQSHDNHIPIGGEMNLIVLNLAEVKNCITTVGGTPFTADAFQFSISYNCPNSGNYLWYGMTKDGTFDQNYASWGGKIRIAGTF